MKNRLRNHGLWMAVFALVLLILQSFGVNVASDKYYEVVNAVLGVLVLLGIINNPTTQDSGFFDDKQNNDGSDRA